MAILNIQTVVTGTSGLEPSVIYILTNDTTATVEATGYLTRANAQGYTFSEKQIAAVYTTDEKVSWYSIDINGSVVSLVPEATPGSVILPVVAGDFTVFADTAGAIEDAGYSPTNAAKTKVVMANAAVIANHIAVYTDTAGTVDDDAATAINAGNISAGLSGTAGAIHSYPSTAAKGKLVLAAIDNTGNTDVTVSNALHGQATVVSIPDGGQATTEFIIADSASTQHITSGALQIDAGDLSVGTAAGGTARSLIAYSPTAARGSIIIKAANAVGDYTSTVTTDTSLGQSTVYTISDAGSATQSILTANIASAGFSSVLKCFDITAGFADLAVGQAVGVVSGAGYKIRSIFLNSGGTNFSGGGGDRLIQISDGTTVYSLIPAATAQTLVNAGWGITTGLPFPASAAINTTTAATLFIAYSGGTTDYTAGSLTLSFVLQKVA